MRVKAFLNLFTLYRDYNVLKSNNNVWLISSLVLLAVSCGQNGSKKLSEVDRYNDMLTRVQTLERNMQALSSASMDELVAYSTAVDTLYYDYNPMELKPEQVEACEALKKRVEILKRDAGVKVQEVQRNYRFNVHSNNDNLLEGITTYPVYLERGDVLYYNIGLQHPGTVKLYNADARHMLKTYAQKTKVVDSLVVANKGIYLVEIVPGKTQYASIGIQFRMGEYHPVKTVYSEEIACKAGDFRAVSNKGIVMKQAFDNARKFTLSSQLKSTFTTAAKSIALVPVQIPVGAMEILYNLRISTSEQDKSSDGKFPDKMNLSYKKVRFLGLPLYESSRGSGLFSTLLDDNRPLREEDAYCNMYVFRNQWAAKQFQDGSKQASQLQYDVEYSTLGTQSCNGRIPTKGARTIYLAFENERVRYSNYIWVEVLTATPTTEYHTTKYTVY